MNLTDILTHLKIHRETHVAWREYLLTLSTEEAEQKYPGWLASQYAEIQHYDDMIAALTDMLTKLSAMEEVIDRIMKLLGGLISPSPTLTPTPP